MKFEGIILTILINLYIDFTTTKFKNYELEYFNMEIKSRMVLLRKYFLI